MVRVMINNIGTTIGSHTGPGTVHCSSGAMSVPTDLIINVMSERSAFYG